MAGQLTIDTLKAGTGVLATQNGMTGIAKAWVNYKGTVTRGINDSFNVSSVTANGVGDYTINFTTAMPNANYSAVMSAETALGAGSFADLMGVVNGGRATGSVRVTCINSTDGAAERDPTAAMVAVFSS